jgi:lipoprotein-releasing system permease protein
MSIAVISLVVWLVLIFLSVTEGIERNWQKKLTTLNAPLRLTPTDAYFSSYYYRIDGVSQASDYTLKTIAQKAAAKETDPYRCEEDEALPLHFPAPDYKDPVKQAYAILDRMQKSHSGFLFQDFELSGALMRLQMVRPGHFPGDGTQSYLTQASYLASFPDKCPYLRELILPPTEQEIEHLFYLSSCATEHCREDAPHVAQKIAPDESRSRLSELLSHVQIKELRSSHSLWHMPSSLLPEATPVAASLRFNGDQLSAIEIPTLKGNGKTGKLWKEHDKLFFQQENQPALIIPFPIPLLVEGPIHFKVDRMSQVGSALRDLLFDVKAEIQGIPVQGTIPFQDVHISKATPLYNSSKTPWIQPNGSLQVNERGETGVLLAKNFQESGVMMGDPGYLSYSSATASGLQEHRLPIFVSGFYDPGVLSIGNKCILVPSFVTETINASSSSFNLDKMQSSGILVWFQDIDQADLIKKELVQALEEQGISKYWKVTTYKEYDFSKDLMQQFQSDKLLFSLVGGIILIVACCNIISLLVLLVNDKKKEIGILQAMGASRYSIALIFGACGMAMGILSSFAGIGVALLTLHNIDAIVSLLSTLQGHDAFNAVFFGNALPNALSQGALKFVLITTPLLSLLAGLVPAIKACRLCPTATLRSE